MILYNVTVNIDDEVREDWLEWMAKVHIPDVLATGLFVGYRFFRVLSRFPEETGTTFSIQYFFLDMADYEEYQQNHAPALQQQHNERYSGRFTAFRTILEEVAQLVP